MKYIRAKQKDMPSIGNCDTCDYILQCTRGSATSTSILKEMLGCPKKLVQQYFRDKGKGELK